MPDPDNRRNIANGEFAAVTAIGAGEATVRFQGKQNRELTLRLSAMRHIDYCYTADLRDAKALLDELSV